MWRFGHLGTAVSALVDGQLDPAEAEQAWNHVVQCAACQRLVEREGWVKRQLTQVAHRPAATGAPSERLLDSLYDLGPADATVHTGGSTAQETLEAWAAVEQLEVRGRHRRRAGIALAGVGSVSAAVLGLSTLGAPLGIGGGAGTGAPATSLSHGAPTAGPTRVVVAPRATVHGRLPGWRVSRDADGVARAVPVGERR